MGKVKSRDKATTSIRWQHLKHRPVLQYNWSRSMSIFATARCLSVSDTVSTHQMLLRHDGTVVNVSVHFSHVVEITMRHLFLRCEFLALVQLYLSQSQNRQIQMHTLEIWHQVRRKKGVCVCSRDARGAQYIFFICTPLTWRWNSACNRVRRSWVKDLTAPFSMNFKRCLAVKQAQAAN